MEDSGAPVRRPSATIGPRLFFMPCNINTIPSRFSASAAAHAAGNAEKAPPHGELPSQQPASQVPSAGADRLNATQPSADVGKQAAIDSLDHASDTDLNDPDTLHQHLLDKAAAYLPLVGHLIDDLVAAAKQHPYLRQWHGLVPLIDNLPSQRDTCKGLLQAMEDRLCRLRMLRTAAYCNATAGKPAQIFDTAIRLEEATFRTTCHETFGQLQGLQATLVAVQSAREYIASPPPPGAVEPAAPRIQPLASTALRLIVAVKGAVALIMAALMTPGRHVSRGVVPQRESADAGVPPAADDRAAERHDHPPTTPAERAWADVVRLWESQARKNPSVPDARRAMLLASDADWFDSLQSHDATIVRFFAMYDLVTRIDEFPPKGQAGGTAPPRLARLFEEQEQEQLESAVRNAIPLYPDDVRDSLLALARLAFPDDEAQQPDDAPAAGAGIPVTDAKTDASIEAASGWTAASGKLLEAVGGMLGTGVSVLAWPVGALLHYSGADAPTAAPPRSAAV